MFDESTESRAFLCHLLEEHRRIEKKVRGVEQIWAGRVRRSQLAELISALLDLRQTLRTHFREEDSGGCIDEAVARSPKLGDLALTIEKEHPILIEQLDQVVAAIQSAGVMGKPLESAKREFSQLVEQIERHEVAESELLEQAFGIEPD